MLSLRRQGDAPSLMATLPDHLNLSGQSIAQINVPPRETLNWWWTCCNSYNPRTESRHYPASDLSRAHKVGARPEITEADQLMMENLRHGSSRSWSCPPGPPGPPPISGPPSRAMTPQMLPPLTPNQLGQKASPGHRTLKRKMSVHLNSVAAQRNPGTVSRHPGFTGGHSGRGQPLRRTFPAQGHNSFAPVGRNGPVPQMISNSMSRTKLLVPRNYELQTRSW